MYKLVYILFYSVSDFKKKWLQLFNPLTNILSIDANFLVQVHSGIWSLTHTMNCWDLDDFVSTLSPPPPLNPISSKKSISGSIENSIRHSFQMMF